MKNLYSSLAVLAVVFAATPAMASHTHPASVTKKVVAPAQVVKAKDGITVFVPKGVQDVQIDIDVQKDRTNIFDTILPWRW